MLLDKDDSAALLPKLEISNKILWQVMYANDKQT